MVIFEDREKASEKQFEDEQKLHFRASYLALKRFGALIAEKLGFKSEGEIDAYVASLEASLIDQPDFKNVLDRIEYDLQGKKIDYSRHRVEVHFREEYEKAKDDIWNGRA